MRFALNRHRRRVSPWLLVLATFIADGRIAAAATTAPLLPAPTGSVVRVSTEPQLQAALANLVSNQTLLIAPGTYRLTSTLHIKGPVSNVALRGESGNRDDVQIVGPGMTNPSYGAAANGIQPRPAGSAPDLGVDEFLAAPNQPPTVWITSPVFMATYTAPAAITVTAEAADGDRSVALVEFYSGDTQIATDTTSPYSAAVAGLAVGTYSLKALAQDNAGVRATSATVTITVTDAVSSPPTLTLKPSINTSST